MQLSLLEEEIKTSFKDAKKIIAAKLKKYDIIIGNPPYGKTKTTPNNYMKNQLLPFAYPENNFDSQGNIIEYSIKNKGIKSKVPEFEKNRGKIEDMYAFGYGVANKLVKENGIISFITSNTILTLPSYKWIRKYFLDNYTIHYIINFNKVMERTNSMFSPESAIATVIFVMSKRKVKENEMIRFLDLSDIDSIKGKYDYFNEIVWCQRRCRIPQFRRSKFPHPFIKFPLTFQIL
jgi:predicted helicase